MEDEWDAIFEKEGKSEVQVEMEGTMDLGFAEEFGGELDRVRKEWSRGRGHWYLVSGSVSELGSERRREGG